MDISRLTETFLTVIAFIYLWFILTNSNPSIANVYLWAAMISIVLLIINTDGVRVTYEKKKGTIFDTLIPAAVGWALLLIISFVVMKFVEPAKASFNSIIGSINAANPAFSNSQVLNLITISFAVGYAETTLFARLMEFFADKFHIPINKQSIFRFSFIVLVLGLSVLFAVFHSTAKGVENFSSLVIVGIMMFISLGLIAIKDGETKSAIFMHILANGVAGFLLIQSGGLLFAN